MNARNNTSGRPTISLGQLHAGQLAAYLALRPHRYMALRCGRRFGKTELARTWIMDGLVRGETCAWFAPQNMTRAEVYTSVVRGLGPLVENAARNAGVIRFTNGARLDFWSLGNAIPGRGRGYNRIVIDEAAFTEPGDQHTPGSMLHTFETAIKPTLLDTGGRVLVCSNSAGKDPDNFFYAICTDPAYGFAEYHATTMDNPVLPKRRSRESNEAWAARRQAEMDTLPIELKHRQGAKVIEPPGAPGCSGRVDRALVRAVALARSWSIRLGSGEAPSLKTLALSEGYCDHYAARLLPLAWLAPDLVELILQGRQPPALSLGALTRKPLPVSWEDQRQLFRDLGRAR